MAVVVSGRKSSGVRRTDSYRDRKLLELEEKLTEVCKQNETLLKKVKFGYNLAKRLCYDCGQFSVSRLSPLSLKKAEKSWH